MIAVVTVSFMVFACYLAAIMLVCKKVTGHIIPLSVSENFYLFEKVKKGFGWLFFGWCTVINGGYV